MVYRIHSKKYMNWLTEYFQGIGVKFSKEGDILLFSGMEKNKIVQQLIAFFKIYVFRNFALEYIQKNYGDKMFYFPEESFKEHLISAIIESSISKQDEKMMSDAVSELFKAKWLHLDGFVQFRMQEDRQVIFLNTDRYMKIYTAKKEYEGFVKLLQQYVETGESWEEEIHIVDGKNGYTIYDHKKEDITLSCRKIFDRDLPEADKGFEDFLLSTLLNLLPKNIIFHIQRRKLNKNFMNTIQLIFEDRIRFCEGCAMCIKQNTAVPLPF